MFEIDMHVQVTYYINLIGITIINLKQLFLQNKIHFHSRLTFRCTKGGGGGWMQPHPKGFLDFIVGIFSAHLSISVAVLLSLRHLF